MVTKKKTPPALPPLPVIDDATALRVAADVGVDPRTVRRAIQGRTKSKATRDAIAASLRRRGHEELAELVAGAA